MRGRGGSPRWQNCFLVPFQQPRSPQWFVFHHELGHNFSWTSSLFARLLGIGVYSEGMASALALADMRRILDSPLQYPLGTTARDSLALVCDNDSQRFRDDFAAWLAAGASFAQLDPNIVDGLWLHHAGSDVFGFAARFFAPLEPVQVASLGPVLCGIANDDDRHTVFAALVSAAAGEDLSATFRDGYHYPLDQALFDTSFAALAGILDGAGAGRVPDGASWPARPLTVERAGGGDVTLHWAPSCRAGDTDYAVYEGTLGDFAERLPMACSTGGATDFTGPAEEGSTYYLVAPIHGGWDGSLGTDSRGAERPPGGLPCTTGGGSREPDGTSTARSPAWTGPGRRWPGGARAIPLRVAAHCAGEYRRGTEPVMSVLNVTPRREPPRPRMPDSPFRLLRGSCGISPSVR